MSDPPLTHSGMARVNEDHTVYLPPTRAIHKWNEPCLPVTQVTGDCKTAVLLTIC